MTFSTDGPIAEGHSFLDPIPGKRIRALIRLVRRNDTAIRFETIEQPVGFYDLSGFGGCSYNELYAALDQPSFPPEARAFLSELPLRTRESFVGNSFLTTIPENAQEVQPGNPSLHPALQDLADAITIDFTEACDGFNSPDMWYAGVDEGITPVSDDHVNLVIWSINREVQRESHRFQKPAPPLTELPWRIQRALVERRRLRYQQWGMGMEQYKSGHWSLWDIPEDPEWVPSKVLGWA